MELSIKNDRENKLLERREIRASAVYDGKTPTREEIKESISKKLSLNPELVEIVKIDQIYGLKSSAVTAYCYTSKEALERYKRKRGAKKEAKPAAAQPSTAEKKENKKQ
jgi:ribosomal protein S24E